MTTRFTDLTEILAADLADDDVFAVSDVSIVGEGSRKITAAELLSKSVPAGPAPILAAGDFNTFITGGNYTLSGVYTNSPLGGLAVSGTLVVLERSFTAGARITQIVNTSGTTPTQYIRVGTGDPVVWSAWRLIVVGPATTSGTPVATTSGTAFDFTSIPAAVQEITVVFVGVSLTGTDSILIQMGTSGGVVTSGYLSTGIRTSGVGGGPISSTSGMVIGCSNAATVASGTMKFTRLAPDSNVWAQDHNMKETSGIVLIGSGDVDLGAEVDRIRITRTGTNTFDAGTVNVRWK